MKKSKVELLMRHQNKFYLVSCSCVVFEELPYLGFHTTLYGRKWLATSLEYGTSVSTIDHPMFSTISECFNWCLKYKETIEKAIASEKNDHTLLEMRNSANKVTSKQYKEIIKQ